MLFKTVVHSSAAALLLALPAANAVAVTTDVDTHTYGLLEGFLVRDANRIPERKLGYGGRLGVGVPLTDTIAIEGSLYQNSINRKNGFNGEQTGLMLDVLQRFDLGLGVDPFVYGGVGGVKERLAFVNDNFLAFEVGLGASTVIGDHYRLRSSISAQDVRDDKISGKSGYIDYRFNVGLLFPFGAAAAAAPVAASKVVDSDGDGIPDSQDRCPNTAASTADGCPAPVAVEPPKDSDGDGVPDSQDACPGTLAGAKVDARGCLVEAASIVLKGVTFVTGSAKLTAEASGELDKAAIALAGQPDVKVEVGGHTDSIGDAKKNTALSQARADAVRKYLIGKGIDAARLTAKGYGSSKPIADNKTKEGRAENRRVELKVVH